MTKLALALSLAIALTACRLDPGDQPELDPSADCGVPEWDDGGLWSEACWAACEATIDQRNREHPRVDCPNWGPVTEAGCIGPDAFGAVDCRCIHWGGGYGCDPAAWEGAATVVERSVLDREVSALSN